MRFVALFAGAVTGHPVLIWEQVERSLLDAGANMLTSVTGEREALEVPLQTEAYRNQGAYQSASG